MQILISTGWQWIYRWLHIVWGSWGVDNLAPEGYIFEAKRKPTEGKAEGRAKLTSPRICKY